LSAGPNRSLPARSDTAAATTVTFRALFRRTCFCNALRFSGKGSKATTAPSSPTILEARSVKNPTFAPMSKKTLPGPSNAWSQCRVCGSYVPSQQPFVPAPTTQRAPLIGPLRTATTLPLGTRRRGARITDLPSCRRVLISI